MERPEENPQAAKKPQPGSQGSLIRFCYELVVPGPRKFCDAVWFVTLMYCIYIVTKSLLIYNWSQYSYSSSEIKSKYSFSLNSLEQSIPFLQLIFT